jgi:predicted peroxiredoxin
MSLKVVLFAFNGELMCFAHGLMYALDMNKRGYDVKMVIEAKALNQMKDLSSAEGKYGDLYRKVRDSGLIDCVCRACAQMTGTLDSALEQELNICDEMNGHPSMAKYMDSGYKVVVI